MSKKFPLLSFLTVLITVLTPLLSYAINIPGTSDPWLAGMPNGSTASLSDSAPGQSPVLVTGLNLSLGGTISFSVSGAVFHDPCCTPIGPDGGGFISHFTGAENGISDIVVPIDALIGVFLDVNQPDTSPAPTALDFSVSGTGFNSLAPGLKQTFFIGDGITGTGSGNVQTFVIPTGATRLFLGTMDGFGWSNNIGSFDVTATQSGGTTTSVSEPNPLLLLTLGLFFFGIAKRYLFQM